MTPLIAAASRGNVLCVQQIITTCRPDLEKRGALDIDLLFPPTCIGRDDYLGQEWWNSCDKLHFHHQTDPMQQWKFRIPATALWSAAKNSHIETSRILHHQVITASTMFSVQALVEGGSNLTSGYGEEFSPLLVAAEACHTQVADFFINQGGLSSKEVLDALELLTDSLANNPIYMAINGQNGVPDAEVYRAFNYLPLARQMMLNNPGFNDNQLLSHQHLTDIQGTELAIACTRLYIRILGPGSLLIHSVLQAR